MTIVLAVAGAALVVFVTGDTLMTTLRVGTHAGPITRSVSRWLWHHFGARPQEGRGWRPTRRTGPLITLAIVLMWLVLMVFGWFLIFSSDSQAVVHGTDGTPADAWSRLYFTAFSISTLGIGDYVPSGAIWQVLTGLVATFGFAMATMVITYVMSLNSAVAAKRQLARTISQLGATPTEIVLRSWDGRHFATLDHYLPSITIALNGLAEQHFTYPLLYYFRSDEAGTAEWPALASLYDVLFLVGHAVHPDVRPSSLTIEPLRAAIDAYLASLPEPVEVGDDVDEPPAPDLDGLREADIPLRSREEIEAALRAATDRRCQLRSALQHQGWTWSDTVGAAGTRT